PSSAGRGRLLPGRGAPLRGRPQRKRHPVGPESRAPRGTRLSGGGEEPDTGRMGPLPPAPPIRARLYVTCRRPFVNSASTDPADARAKHPAWRSTMNRTRLAILLLVAAGPRIVASLAGASGLTYSGRSGRLAFATLGSNVDIYSLLTKGQEPMGLTPAKAFDACPALSRDGGTITYCSDATGSYEIWTMRADGSGKHRET